MVYRHINCNWNLLCRNLKMQNLEVNLKVSDTYIICYNQHSATSSLRRQTFFLLAFMGPFTGRKTWCYYWSYTSHLLWSETVIADPIIFYTSHVDPFCGVACRPLQTYGGADRWCGQIEWNGFLLIFLRLLTNLFGLKHGIIMQPKALLALINNKWKQKWAFKVMMEEGSNCSLVEFPSADSLANLGLCLVVKGIKVSPLDPDLSITYFLLGNSENR